MKRSKAFANELDAITPELLERAHGHCELRIVACGGPLHRHHRLRRSHGGNNTLENLLVLCSNCHAYVHSEVSESYLNGWLIRGVK